MAMFQRVVKYPMSEITRFISATEYQKLIIEKMFIIICYVVYQ